jgi:hypothetical protein
MAEEMIESLAPFESDEAEDWEADEAFAEADDAAEDIGERARRRRRSRPWRRNAYRPVRRGVRGMTMRGQDGVRNVQFPEKLATAAETNRGLAAQELARHDLERRIFDLERKLRDAPKKGAAASGLVTLAIGGGLATWGAFEAAKKNSGSALSNWAEEKTTQMAAVASATQLAATGARIATSGGGYAASALGVAADAYSALQLAAFAIGSLRQQGRPTGVADRAELLRRVGIRDVKVGQTYITLSDGFEYEIIETDTGSVVAKPLSQQFAAPGGGPQPSGMAALSGPGNPSPASGATGGGGAGTPSQPTAVQLHLLLSQMQDTLKQIQAAYAKP